jgi:hypothetical protein
MLSGKWRITLILAMVGVAIAALGLFIHAGSWSSADPIASTLGFFLGLGGLILGLVTLLLQVRANREQRLHLGAGAKPKLEDSKAAKSKPGAQRHSQIKFRWLMRLGTPSAAAGAGGCIVDIALGATILSSVGAMTLAVSPGFADSAPIRGPSRTVISASPSEYPTVGASPSEYPTVGNTPPTMGTPEVSGSFTAPPKEVRNCAYFRGNADIPQGATLILASQRIDASNGSWNVEGVFDDQNPTRLEQWRGVLHFGNAVNQQYEVALITIPYENYVALMRDPAAANSLIREGTTLDTTEVIRVSGVTPGNCER